MNSAASSTPDVRREMAISAKICSKQDGEVCIDNITNNTLFESEMRDVMKEVEPIS